MKKSLLLLAAGAMTLPGLAIADAHGYSSSISGQVRVQHTQSTSDGVSSGSNSLGGDDSFLKWNHKYKSAKGEADGSITFQPSGEWRYSAGGKVNPDENSSWTAEAKAEWDFDMTNTSSTTAESTAYRDVYIKLSEDSGLYFQLGNKQYGDQMKGYSNSNGGGLSRGSGTAADNVLSNGDYDGSAYFVSDEARFAALQVGYAPKGPKGPKGSNLNVNLVLQMDTDAALFGAVSNDAATNTLNDDPDTDDVDETGTTVTTTQSTFGTLLQLQYSTKDGDDKVLDLVLNRYDGSVEDADTDPVANSDPNSADGKAEFSATQFGISYKLGGMFTPFFNMLMASVDQTTDDGATTTTDAQVMNVGTVVSLAGDDAVNVSYTMTSADESGTAGTDDEESGSAIELQYTTEIAGVAINAGYGSGEYDDDSDATKDDDDSYISVRLQYSF